MPTYTTTPAHDHAITTTTLRGVGDRLVIGTGENRCTVSVVEVGTGGKVKLAVTVARGVPVYKAENVPQQVSR